MQAYITIFIAWLPENAKLVDVRYQLDRRTFAINVCNLTVMFEIALFISTVDC